MSRDLLAYLRHWDSPAAHEGIRVRLLTEALRRRHPSTPQYVLAAVVHDYLRHH